MEHLVLAGFTDKQSTTELISHNHNSNVLVHQHFTIEILYKKALVRMKKILWNTNQMQNFFKRSSTPLFPLPAPVLKT